MLLVTKRLLSIRSSLTTRLNINFCLRVMMSSTESEEILRNAVKAIIPPLSQDKHKGQAGRIGIVGGCQEYTGAPYFAAISAIKAGADLSHVFCMKDAAPVIKSYSPELIVHPILDEQDSVAKIGEWLPRLHALVIGPGLGREEAIVNSVKSLVNKAKEMDMPLVIDADGLYVVTQDPNLVHGYKKAILTPNIMEFSRLHQKVCGEVGGEMSREAAVSLSHKLGGVTIVCKGQEDIITDGNHVLVCKQEGSARRCGGQGDLLSGSMGAFSYWGHLALPTSNNGELQKYGANAIAAYGACMLTRECARLAFTRCQRSTTTSDMIAQIHYAFENLFC